MHQIHFKLLLVCVPRIPFYRHEMVRVVEELEPPTGQGQFNYVIDNVESFFFHFIVRFG
jgi:hypothetical protein